jgi:DNA-directed RNA polymerase sigma subunit (sigma70/sigma32)
MMVSAMAVSGHAHRSRPSVYPARAVPEPDPLLSALSDLDREIGENIERASLMKRRIAQIRRDRAAGRSYREIVEAEEGALFARLLSESRRALDDTGARVRRTEALALHDEGMTMEQIAEMFGVTRQRVSGLLRDARAESG